MSAVLGGHLPRFRCIWTLAWDWGLGSASHPSGRPHRGRRGRRRGSLRNWDPGHRRLRGAHPHKHVLPVLDTRPLPATSTRRPHLLRGNRLLGMGIHSRRLSQKPEQPPCPHPAPLSAPCLLSAAPATPALPQILSTLNHHALCAHHDLAGPSTARLLPALPVVGLQGPPHPSTCSPWSQAAAPAAPRAQSGRAPLSPAR